MSLLVDFFSPRSLQLGSFTEAFMNNEIKGSEFGNFIITLIYYNHAQCHCWWIFFLRGHCNLVALLKHL